jgi:hypothetical protein
VLRETAVEFGVCVRPLPMRRVDLATGEVEIKDVPCGSTRAAVCLPCADRARRLRAQQCREGWHLTEDPDLTRRPATEGQRDLVTTRAQITEAVEDAEHIGDELTAEACRESAAAVDDELAASGARGTLDPQGKPRRVRSTRRRQDTPDLPRRTSNGTTVGRVYTDERTGKTFRPSLFVTLTLPSYGRVRRDDHMPVDPSTYDYTRAAGMRCTSASSSTAGARTCAGSPGTTFSTSQSWSRRSEPRRTRTSPSAAPCPGPW